MNPNDRKPVPGVRPATFSEAAPWAAQILSASGLQPSEHVSSGGFVVEDDAVSPFGTLLVTLFDSQEGDDDRAEAALAKAGARVERFKAFPPQFLVSAPEEIAHPMHWQWSEDAGHAYCEHRHHADPRTRKTTDKSKVTCTECRTYLDARDTRRQTFQDQVAARAARYREREETLLGTVLDARTEAEARDALAAVRAAERADWLLSRQVGERVFSDGDEAWTEILEAPHETRTDDNRTKVLARAKVIRTGRRIWLEREELI